MRQRGAALVRRIVFKHCGIGDDRDFPVADPAFCDDDPRLVPPRILHLGAVAVHPPD